MQCRSRKEVIIMNIMGKSVLTKEQMEKHLYKVNPKAPSDVVKLFLHFGELEGVRGDVAFCQSVLETNYFRWGGDAKPEWHNPAGLGVTGVPNAGERFNSWNEGIIAQVQHLKAYASKEPLNTKLIDNRFKLVQRGIAPTLYDLQGRWATGANYAEKIIRIYKEVEKIKVQELTEEEKMEKLVNELSTFIKIDNKYWENVLLGRTSLNPNYLKIIFQRFIDSKHRE
jgi:hypothetical protein